MSELPIFNIVKALIQLAPELVDLIEKVIADLRKEDPSKSSPINPPAKPSIPSKDAQ